MNIKINAFIFFLLILNSCTNKNNSKIVHTENSVLEVDTLANVDVKEVILSSDRTDDSLKINFLLNFYSEYIPVVANNTNIDEISAIEEKVSSKKLLEKINSINLDYYAYLNAQDAHESSVESLAVKQCDNDISIFCVSFLTGYNDEITNIKLRVLMIKGEPKVVDIIGLQ